MQAAVVNGVEGIEAECGGGLACATCHVYVDPSWQARLPPPAPAEDAMLDATAAERKDSSRLCCQIVVAEELEGLILHLPACQT
jgi:2Fe-2S ferredoxin